MLSTLIWHIPTTAMSLSRRAGLCRLTYLAHTILEAQPNTMKRLELYLSKAKFYNELRGQLNERQEKAVARMFREGVDGFKGGLSAENYISVTRSCATATRDLQRPRRQGALRRTDLV